MSNRVTLQNKMFEEQTCSGFSVKDCSITSVTLGVGVDVASVFDLRPVGFYHKAIVWCDVGRGAVLGLGVALGA